MKGRTALSLFLDSAQKKAFLKHYIWSVDLLSEEEKEEITNRLDIPRIIMPEVSLPQRKTDLTEYLCGIETVDRYLSKFMAGCLTEICGMPGSGRTHLCLRYAHNHKTLWIDTEGCLSPPEGMELYLVRIHDHLQLFALIYKIPLLMERIAPEVIVIDSIAAALRGEASSDSVDRTALLAELARTLKVVAAKHGIPVIVTNHMSKVPYHGNVRTLGKAWASTPTHCFETRKGFSGSRVLRVLKSPSIPRIDIEL